MNWLERNHRWVFYALVGLMLLALSEMAHAFRICWQAPTETITGEPLTGDNALAHFTVYYGQEQAGQWDRTLLVEQITDGCVNIRASRGYWYAAMTATNVQGETSALSNWVRKEENRLAGPRDGRLLGPSNGRLID